MSDDDCMSTNVEWILEMQVQAGRADALRALMAEMVADTQTNEPGTLIYEFALSADGTRCHVHERYADNDAVLAHLKTFGEKYAARFFADLATTRCVVYGSPSDAVKEALKGANPIYMAVAAGFMR